MREYAVEYKLTSTDEARCISLFADSKEDAYDRAVFESIPKREGEYPYSAWVLSVTYSNGNYKLFNTFEGKPY